VSQQVPVVTDPCVALGRIAGLLADGDPLADVLDALCGGLALQAAVLRSATGELLAVGGDVLQTVPQLRAVSSGDPDLELPVQGGTLTVVGAGASQLAVLQAAAAVLGLGLAPDRAAADLLDAAEQDRDEIADALHDGPVQALVAARYAADAAVRGGDPGLARDAVQEGLVQVRRALWQLRPRAATGLLEALQQLSAQRVEAGSAPIHLAGDVEALAALHGTRATAAYRLVQAVCQVDGAPVRVTAHREGVALVLEVDGAARLPSAKRWTLRARALGGDLAPHAGRLRLVLPLGLSHPDARTAP
jgi:two-component system NarL family sensor kinase